MNSLFTFNRLLVVVMSFLSLTSYSQTSFLTTFPTTYDKDAREVLVTPDGGYLIAGSTNNSNPVDADLYVLKTDAQGNFLWGKTYGGPKPEYAFSMIETADGNYFVLGYSQSFSSGDFDTYLIKIDPTGTLLWQKVYGGTGNEHGKEIIKSSDGNYVFVGSSNSNFTSQQAFLTKIDLAGTVLWTKNYGGNMEEGGNSVKETQGGGFIVSGQTFSYGQNNGSVYLVKTNNMGDTTWTKFYNTGTIISEATSIVSNNDGSYVFAVRDSSANSDVDVRIMKTDPMGAILWNKLYGGTKKDTPKRIISTTDGGYVLASTSRSFGWINPDMWILKLNASGDTLWTNHFGGINHEHGNDIKQTVDGGYIAVGHAKSYGTDGQRIMLVKMNSSGAVGIKKIQEDLSFQIYPNPSNDGNLNLRVGKNIFSKITISNLIGEQIFNEPVTLESSEPKKISLGTNVPGIYLVTIKSDNAIITKKIILE